IRPLLSGTHPSWTLRRPYKRKCKRFNAKSLAMVPAQMVQIENCRAGDNVRGRTFRFCSRTADKDLVRPTAGRANIFHAAAGEYDVRRERDQLGRVSASIVCFD